MAEPEVNAAPGETAVGRVQMLVDRLHLNFTALIKCGANMLVYFHLSLILQ